MERREEIERIRRDWTNHSDSGRHHGLDHLRGRVQCRVAVLGHALRLTRMSSTRVCTVIWRSTWMRPDALSLLLHTTRRYIVVVDVANWCRSVLLSARSRRQQLPWLLILLMVGPVISRRVIRIYRYRDWLGTLCSAHTIIDH